MIEKNFDIELKNAVLEFGDVNLLKFIRAEYIDVTNNEDTSDDIKRKLPIGDRRIAIDKLEREVKVVCLARMNAIIEGSSMSVSLTAILISLVSIYFAILINMTSKILTYFLLGILFAFVLLSTIERLKVRRKMLRDAVFFKTIIEDSISKKQ